MKTVNDIKNYIQLHTSDMENDDYINFMRELAEWAENQANLTEYREENLEEFNEE